MRISCIRKALAVTTVLGVAGGVVAGYGRFAYGQCVAAGDGDGRYVCAGAGVGGQSINGVSDARLKTAAGFSLSAGAGVDGISVSGDGEIGFADDVGAMIAAGGFGLRLESTGDRGTVAGRVTVAAASDIDAGGTGVFARNYGAGDIDLHLTGTVAGGVAGIVAAHYGMTDAGDIRIAATTVAAAQGRGIDAHHHGAGGIAVTLSGDLTAGGDGIYARTAKTGAAGTVTLASTGTITAGGTGINAAQQAAGGGLSVTAQGAITSDADGIYLVNHGNQGLQLLAGRIDAGGTGIAVHTTRGRVDVTASAAVSAAGDGVVITATGDSGATVVDLAAVDSRGGNGLYVETAGDLAVTARGPVTGAQTGAMLRSDGRIAATFDEITGGYRGLVGYSLGDSAITAGAIRVDADISGSTAALLRSYAGLSATFTGGITGDDGIVAQSAGDLAVTVAGDVRAANRAASITAHGDRATVTLEKGARLEGAIGLVVQSYTAGETVIDTAGTIAGASGVAVDVTGGYQAAGAVALNIHGGRIIGDVTDSAHWYTGESGRTSVTVAGDFTSEGNFAVERFAVAAGATFTPGAETQVTPRAGAITVDGVFAVLNDRSRAGSGLHVNNGGVLDIRRDFEIAGALDNKGTVAIASGRRLTVDRMEQGAGGQMSFGLAAMDDYAQLVIRNGAADLTEQTVTAVFTPDARFDSGDRLRVIDGTLPVLGKPDDDGIAVETNTPVWTVRLVGDDDGGDGSDLYFVLDKAAPPPVAVHQATAVAGMAFTGSAVATTGLRLSQMRHDDASGIAAGDDSQSRNRVWVEGLGQYAHQGTYKGAAGYRARTGGATIGVDTDQYIDRGTLGLAFSYGQSRIDGADAQETATDIDSYQLTFYGDYNWDNGVYADGMAGYGIGRNKTRRHNAGGAGLHADGDFNARNLMLRAELGRRFTSGAAFFTPFARADWLRYDADGYRETGAGAGNLQVSAKSLDQLDLGLGAKAGIAHRRHNGDIIVPELHASFRRDLRGDTLATTQSYITGAGPAFLSTAPAQPKNKLSLGATVRYFTTNNLSLDAAYEAEIRQNYTAHTAVVRMGWGF